MHKLDRVFHGQDVAEFGFVQVVHHGSQCGGFARARGAGYQHQPARLERQITKNLGCVELFQRQDLAWDGPEHGTRAAVVVERVHPEPGQTVNFKRKVYLQELFVVLALGVVHDVVHHGMHGLVVQRLDVDSPHVTVNTNHRRQVS